MATSVNSYGSINTTSVTSSQVRECYYEPQELDLRVAQNILIVKEILPHILEVIQNTSSIEDQNFLEPLRSRSLSRWDVITLNHTEINRLLLIINNPEEPSLQVEEMEPTEEGKILVGKSITLLKDGGEKKIFVLSQRAMKALNSCSRSCCLEKIQKFQIFWDQHGCYKGSIVFGVTFLTLAALGLIFGEHSPGNGMIYN